MKKRLSLFLCLMLPCIALAENAPILTPTDFSFFTIGLQEWDTYTDFNEWVDISPISPDDHTVYLVRIWRLTNDVAAEINAAENLDTYVQGLLDFDIFLAELNNTPMSNVQVHRVAFEGNRFECITSCTMDYSNFDDRGIFDQYTMTVYFIESPELYYSVNFNAPSLEELEALAALYLNTITFE